MLDNIPSHFSTEIEQLSSILEELCISLKRKQVFSPTMIHFALMLRYTSLQSYRLLLNELPFPSISGKGYYFNI